MLKGHNPHLGLPESRRIKLENGLREEKSSSSGSISSSNSS
jgi:hypothetical protein